VGCRQPLVRRSRLPLGLPLAGILGPPLAGASGLPVTGEATGVAPLDVIAARSSVSGVRDDTVAADAAFPIAAGSSFRHVFGGLLLPVSLWALAAGALPGAGGLVILTAAGVRVGYRQAKAGFVVQAAGIARVAGPGPLGVVHSGSLIVVRPRVLRVARPRASSGRSIKSPSTRLTRARIGLRVTVERRDQGQGNPQTIASAALGARHQNGSARHPSRMACRSRRRSC
jgi:hypothetical protein